MLTYEQLRQQIGEWSRQNFGGQETPYLKVFRAGNIYPGDKRGKGERCGAGPAPDTVVALESIAPLMGMMEELGELFGAKTIGDLTDACGDIAVYLCDYLSREGMVWPVTPDESLLPQHDPSVPTMAPEYRMVVALGDLSHATLKHHQRIRGMHDLTAYHTARAEAVRALTVALEIYASDVLETSLPVILNNVWTKVVAKRNWKADANAGGGATHEPSPSAREREAHRLHAIGFDSGSVESFQIKRFPETK